MSQAENVMNKTLEEARDLLEAGNIPSARRRLHAVLQDDPENHKAWLWLSGITESADASLEYVRKASAIAPDDPSVAKALEWAEQRAFRKQASSPQAARLVEQPKRRPRVAPAPIRPDSSEDAAGEPVVVKPKEDGLGNWIRWFVFVVLLVALLALIGFLIIWRGGAQRIPLAAQVVSAETIAQRSLSAQGKRRILSTTEHPPIVVSWDEAPPVPESLAFDEGLSINSAENETQEAAHELVLDENGMIDKPAIASAEPLPMWTPTPPPTPAPTREAPQQADTVAPLQTAYAGSSHSQHAQFNEARWINIDLSNQVLTAYENGEPVFTTLISSGAPGMETVTGQFRIYARLESQHMSGYHLGFNYSTPNVPHVQYFHGNFGIHGAYWHEDFGTPVSHGCVNLDEPDAAWLYNFAGIGTLVNVHY